MKTPEARLNAIERSLGGPGVRRSLSHAQLVAIVEARCAGRPDPKIDPAEMEVVEPGRKSLVELIAEAARRSTGSASGLLLPPFFVFKE